ncbi:hypothetical protein PDE_09147 [Penicillium oxalicum 114-2]|uniref:Uncharacterized protein n=1 Tax=Penicillium oxalicum (strain 114-2 / CGMCC 5302) TaxID=933388 RepID=S8B5P0_PENO1|nr:hypothetical protein PDE_09147 [Penicillium oxalicum 114-2]
MHRCHAACAPATSSTPDGPDSELCKNAYEACTQFLVSKLDGIVAFRQELIETSKDWRALGFVGPCPFALPTPEELALHRKEYRIFEAAQSLKHDLASFLDSASDGWVPLENWEAAKTQNMAMFNEMLQAVLENQDPDDDEPIRNERNLRDIWPFDLPGEEQKRSVDGMVGESSSTGESCRGHKDAFKIERN